jgi:hypothetical protein
VFQLFPLPFLESSRVENISVDFEEWRRPWLGKRSKLNDRANGDQAQSFHCDKV